MADHERVVALSDQFIQTHRALRASLAATRDRLAAGMDAASEGAGTMDLLTHCRPVCAALHRHASSEDTQLTPRLRAADPGLASVLDNMVLDHVLVRSLVERINALSMRGSDADPAKVVREFDRLAVILGAHMDYEERRIGAAIDTLGHGTWTKDVLAGPEATEDVVGVAR
jgi:hypothetical protein